MNLKHNIMSIEKKLNSVKVIFADEKYNYETSMSANSTEQTVKKYFVGKRFNVEAYPKQDLKECINIEFTDNNIIAIDSDIYTVNGYKIRFNSLWEMWQVSHDEIGSCIAEFKIDQDAIDYCNNG
jgi:hypothetical protein